MYHDTAWNLAPAAPGSTRADSGLTPFDPGATSIARVYNALVDGAANFRADRAISRQLLDAQPALPHWVATTRKCVDRALHAAVQDEPPLVLDMGPGDPQAFGPVHQAAWRANPDTEVVLVDIDRTVVAAARAAAATDPRVSVLRGDLRDASRVLAHPSVRGAIKDGRKIALIMANVLHFVPDNPVDRDALLGPWLEALPFGSTLIITHASDSPLMTADERHALAAYQKEVAPLALRSADAGARLLRDWDLGDTGVKNPGMLGTVPESDPWPDDVYRLPGWAAVARKSRRMV
ncbi:MAG: hypothetical protein V7607_5415 [Solirubrobacteraceae bacterium]